MASDDKPEPVTCNGYLLIDAKGKSTFCDEYDDFDERASSATLTSPWRIIPLEVTARPHTMVPPLTITAPDVVPEPASITAG